MAKHLTPHDRLFRKMLAKPKVAKEFFASHLPMHIKSAIDLDSIELQKESFIDDKLRMKITDLLYSAQFGKRSGYLYLLVEHQSSPDVLMPFRILKYKIAIMEHHLKTYKKKQLPIIYPLILYSGKRKYNHSTDIFDLFGDQRKLAEDILYKPYQLVDLNKIPNEKLKKDLWFGVMARMMKNIYNSDILPFFKILINDLKSIEKFGDLDYIYTIISYVFEARKPEDREDFVNMLTRNLTINEGEIMTIADQYRTEGRVEGRAEGRAAALKEIMEMPENELLALQAELRKKYH